MSRLRSLSTVLASAVVAALVGFLLSGGPARGDAATPLADPAGITKWSRRLLRTSARCSARSARRTSDKPIPHSWLRHPPHGLLTDRSCARHRCRRAVDLWSVAADRCDIRRQHDGPEADVCATGVVEVPVPTTITNIIATLQGTDPRRPDRMLRRGRAHDDHVTRCAGFHERRAGRGQGRLGRRRDARARARDGVAPGRRRQSCLLPSPRGAGIYGSAFSAAQLAAAGANVQAFLNMDTIVLAGRQWRQRAAHRSTCSQKACRRRPRRTISQYSRWPVENDGSARQLARYIKETGENGATGMNVNLVWRRNAISRGSDQLSFLSSRLPCRPFQRAQRELQP